MTRPPSPRQRWVSQWEPEEPPSLSRPPIFLMGDVFAIGWCQRPLIRQNLVIALGVIALLLIASGFGVIPLSIAVVLHEGSMVCALVGGSGVAVNFSIHK